MPDWLLVLGGRNHSVCYPKPAPHHTHPCNNEALIRQLIKVIAC